MKIKLVRWPKGSYTIMSPKNYYYRNKTYKIYIQYPSGYRHRLKAKPDIYCNDNHAYFIHKGNYVGSLPMKDLQGNELVLHKYD